MSKEEVLLRAKEFVRETFEKDLNQKIDEKQVRAIAEKVAKSVPRVLQKA
jgi:hypothetical protein